jgi:hypothetical protein
MVCCYRRTVLLRKGDNVKKPINKVALALWIIAVVFVLGEVWTTIDMYRSIAEIHGQGDNVYMVGGGLERIVQSVIGTAAMLTAMGVLIELVDQIRWAIVRAAEKS